MAKMAGFLLAAAGWLLLTSAAPPGSDPAGASQAVAPPPAKAQPAVPPPPPPPPTVQQSLQNGVTIVISKASQRMYVFRDGALWRSSPVSTGRRGHATPAGVFPILQKKVFHRSNLYSGAPMPYMQRLTWTGIAIHAGRLPGYPASHGCIRVPREFARALYGVTRASNTAVLIANDPLGTEHAAFALASSTVLPGDREVRLAQASQPVVAPRSALAPPKIVAAKVLTDTAPVQQALFAGGKSQTIQLAAAKTPAEAAQLWQQLVMARPELGRMQYAIIPAVVGSGQVYRLRASAPQAHALCGALKRSGIACFNVA